MATVVLRKRDALGYSTVQALYEDLPGSYYGVGNRNTRFLNILCIDEENIENEYPQLYEAVNNAYDPNGIDYSNGACYWDGYDLATGGVEHPHYKLYGYIFTDPSHNLWPSLISTTPPKNRKGDKTYPGGLPIYYDWVFESTAAYGQTIFFKLNSEYVNAIWGAKQCK
jgi:hypothetical protein